MRPTTIRNFTLTLLLVFAMPARAQVASPQMVSPEVIADYQHKLAEYQAAHDAYEADASAYWSSIAEKRRGRNAKRREHQQVTLDDYVLTQPPVYSGPRRPINPQPEPQVEATPRPKKMIPVVADLLQAASDNFQWTPQRPASELDFKRAYARFATAAGLTRDQAVRVYAFETGGNGNHDMQAASVQVLALGGPVRTRSRPRSATTSSSPPTASS